MSMQKQPNKQPAGAQQANSLFGATKRQTENSATPSRTSEAWLEFLRAAKKLQKSLAGDGAVVSLSVAQKSLARAQGFSDVHEAKKAKDRGAFFSATPAASGSSGSGTATERVARERRSLGRLQTALERIDPEAGRPSPKAMEALELSAGSPALAAEEWQERLPNLRLSPKEWRGVGKWLLGRSVDFQDELRRRLADDLWAWPQSLEGIAACAQIFASPSARNALRTRWHPVFLLASWNGQYPARDELPGERLKQLHAGWSAGWEEGVAGASWKTAAPTGPWNELARIRSDRGPVAKWDRPLWQRLSVWDADLVVLALENDPNCMQWPAPEGACTGAAFFGELLALPLCLDRPCGWGWEHLEKACGSTRPLMAARWESMTKKQAIDFAEDWLNKFKKWDCAPKALAWISPWLSLDFAQIVLTKTTTTLSRSLALTECLTLEWAGSRQWLFCREKDARQLVHEQWARKLRPYLSRGADGGFEFVGAFDDFWASRLNASFWRRAWIEDREGLSQWLRTTGASQLCFHAFYACWSPSELVEAGGAMPTPMALGRSDLLLLAPAVHPFVMISPSINRSFSALFSDPAGEEHGLPERWVRGWDAWAFEQWSQCNQGTWAALAWTLNWAFAQKLTTDRPPSSMGLDAAGWQTFHARVKSVLRKKESDFPKVKRSLDWRSAWDLIAQGSGRWGDSAFYHATSNPGFWAAAMAAAEENGLSEAIVSTIQDAATFILSRKAKP